MDNRPIGFFDSGLGGLTCVTKIMEALPNEQIIYFGDTARTPYGSKAVSTIKKFSNQIAEFLVKNDVKMIVIACNTVSAICLDELQRKYPDIPVIGVIEPAVDRVAETCRNSESIGVIGTKATIKSKAYEEKIADKRKDLVISSMACPIFVPLIEEGIIENEIMDLSIKHYLDDFISNNGVETLVLGCTHYPLIKGNITRIYPDLKIINPSEIVQMKLERVLEKIDGFADTKAGEHIFYASDLSENFINMINAIFNETGFKVAFKNFEIGEK